MAVRWMVVNSCLLARNVSHGSVYQCICLHHHLVSAAVSRLSYLPGITAPTHSSTFMIA